MKAARFLAACRYVLDLVFPCRCVGCRGLLLRPPGGPAPALCESCVAAIPLHRSLFCAECGARLTGEEKICHREAPYVLGAASSYAVLPLQNAITNFKFKFVEDAAEPLARILIRYAEPLRVPWREYAAVPIPLSARRRRSRGFNQSELIARKFAAHFSMPLAPDALVRTRHAKPQSGLKFEKRAGNVAGCFAAAAEVPKNIVLIDDVTTSGATFREAAEELRRAGARRIIALALAKA